jgi:hypothetical protein
MRPNQQNKNRQRGRNNNGGRKHINPLSRNFESNGPDVKVRGNAAHIAEKYLQLARDAQSSGDSVMAENYLQHAEHYFRILAAAQPQNQQRPDQFGQTAEVDEDDDFPPINDRFSSPEPRTYAPEPQPPQQFGQPQFSQPQAQPANGEANGTEPAVAIAPQPQGAAAEGQAGAPQANGEFEGEPRRHRDRRGRRRGRGGDGQAGSDPANAPQPEVGDLPAFITAGQPAAE